MPLLPITLAVAYVALYVAWWLGRRTGYRDGVEDVKEEARHWKAVAWVAWEDEPRQVRCYGAEANRG